MTHTNRVTVAAFFLLAPVALLADDQLTVSHLCREFEKARLRCDLHAATQLIAKGATSYNSLGGEPISVVAELTGGARWLKSVKRAQLPATQLVDETINVIGDTAVVTQLFWVEGQSPMRRTIICVKQVSWRINHIHASKYTAWENDMKKFADADKESPTKPGGVVFTGSSSIRMWRNVKQAFPEVNVIHRGFGGSQMIDAAVYATRLVTSHKPRAVLVYEGDNDVAKGKSPERILKNFKAFVAIVRADSPDTTIGFIAIKPSIRRENLLPVMKKANQLVEEYARSTKGVDYLDVATPMMTAAGKIRDDIFIRDNLHMNAKGYAIWQKALAPWVNRFKK